MGMIWMSWAVDEGQARDLLAGDLDPHDVPGSEPAVVDLDKAWHGLHWLLTGTEYDGGPEPLASALMGGQPFGDDAGYGPPRLLTPEWARAIDAALRAVPDDLLRQRFDAGRMEELSIYPDSWHPSDFEVYLTPYLEMLRDHYAYAASRDLGTVQQLT